jgi:Na+/phosphate symporter
MTNGSDRENHHLSEAPDCRSATLTQGCLIMIGKLIETTLSLSVCISADEPDEIGRCETRAKELREHERALTREMHAVALGDAFSPLVSVPHLLRNVSEKLENIVKCCSARAEEGVRLNGTGEAHCQQLLAILIDMMRNLEDALIMTDTVLLQSIISQGGELSRMLRNFRSTYWLRPRKGPTATQMMGTYLDILDAIKSANEEVENICTTLLKTARGAL